MSATPNATRFSQTQPIHHTVFSNGLTVVAMENPAADIVATRILVKGGARCEQKSQAGIAHLLSTVLTKGTDRLSSQEIAEKVESVGASLGADAASDYCLLSFKTVSDDFSNILKLAAEILRSPSFPEHEIELERRLTLQGIRSMQEQPFTVAYQQLRSGLYGDHPYAVSGLGTEESVSQITREDLLTYYSTYFRPDNMIISLAGRISPHEAIAQIEAVLGDWQPQGEWGDRPNLSPVLEFSFTPQVFTTVQDTMQAIVMLGYPTASVHSPDYGPLKLLSTHLGNGLSSRLFVELREKRGLAYDVSSIYPTRADWSHFVVYMGTAPVNVPVAIDGLRSEVDRLVNQPLTDEELKVAKNKLLGQYSLGKQTNAQLAQLLGWYEALGLGIEFDQTFQSMVAAITSEELQAIATRYLATDPCLSLVGPASAILKS